MRRLGIVPNVFFEFLHPYKPQVSFSSFPYLVCCGVIVRGDNVRQKYIVCGLPNSKVRCKKDGAQSKISFVWNDFRLICVLW